MSWSTLRFLSHNSWSRTYIWYRFTAQTVKSPQFILMLLQFLKWILVDNPLWLILLLVLIFLLLVSLLLNFPWIQYLTFSGLWFETQNFGFFIICNYKKENISKKLFHGILIFLAIPLIAKTYCISTLFLCSYCFLWNQIMHGKSCTLLFKQQKIWKNFNKLWLTWWMDSWHNVTNMFFFQFPLL